MTNQRPTVYDRLVSMIRETGYTESYREWCTSAGLSEGYISNLRDRCLKNPAATIRGSAAVKIAAKLGVTVDDLLEAAAPSSSDSRDAAIAAARSLGYSPEAIAAGTGGDAPADDPGVFWYFRRIEAEDERIRNSRPSSVMRSLKRK